jgi:hypothetical protein
VGIAVGVRLNEATKIDVVLSHELLDYDFLEASWVEVEESELILSFLTFPLLLFDDVPLSLLFSLLILSFVSVSIVIIVAATVFIAVVVVIFALIFDVVVAIVAVVIVVIFVIVGAVFAVVVVVVVAAAATPFAACPQRLLSGPREYVRKIIFSEPQKALRAVGLAVFAPIPF